MPTKIAETDSEIPPQINDGSFTRHHYHHHHSSMMRRPTEVSYKECLKNHAATIGGHALDGCGEFIASTASTDPTLLNCAACGCHRNFHRREPEDRDNNVLGLHYYHHNRPCHTISLPTSPPRRSSSPSFSLSPSTSPSSPIPLQVAPLPSYSSAPLVLLEFGTGFPGRPDEHLQKLNPMLIKPESTNGKKRRRTKLSKEQKEKMCLFSEKIGWKMQKSDGRLVEAFCNEIGICRRVLKIWMHNNKQTLMKGEKACDVDNHN